MHTISYKPVSPVHLGGCIRSSYFPFGKGYPQPHLPSPIHTEVQASLPRPPAHVDFQFSSASDYRGSHPTLYPHCHLSAGQSVSDSLLRAGPDHVTGSLRPSVAPHSPRQSVGSFADFGCLLSVVCHGQRLNHSSHLLPSSVWAYQTPARYSVFRPCIRWASFVPLCPSTPSS